MGRVGEGGYTPPVSVRRFSLGLHYKTRLCVYVLEAKTCNWHLQATLIRSMALIKWVFKTALRKQNLCLMGPSDLGEGVPDNPTRERPPYNISIYTWNLNSVSDAKAWRIVLFVTCSSSKTTWQTCRWNVAFWDKMSFYCEWKYLWGRRICVAFTSLILHALKATCNITFLRCVSKVLTVFKAVKATSLHYV